MKRVLSLLLCYVFLMTEAFALRGGPSGANGIEKVLGAYSGTMVETNPVGGTTTSVGLFTLTAIENGASTGQVVFFASSNTDVSTYAGTIAGLSDPENGTFTGVLGASDATGQIGTSTQSGQISCTAKKSFKSTYQRLNGTASSRNVSVIIAGNNIVKTIGNLTSYTVSGWRTSTTDAGNPLPSTFSSGS